jgi:hypothetical protein
MLVAAQTEVKPSGAHAIALARMEETPTLPSRRGPRHPVSISVSPIGATRAPRWGLARSTSSS